MATYLANVTDYIPQFQPFQPDLNFYGNILQTKQSQYDSNWKALNSMYGKYYHADLTRDENVTKRDEHLKQIEFNLKRVSQLDLSLEQNVNQATQIFKPFYEDKNLIKDMAWTQNKNAQLTKAEILRNSNKVEDNKKYWSEGVRAVEYMTEEFKNASSEEALSFANAEYVPNVDVLGLAQKLAKESGLKVVDFQDDGRFMVKRQNGELLIEPLQRLFEAQLGSDEAIQRKYEIQAYVDRKDYATTNAALFGGDKNAAEMKYLETAYNTLKEQTQQRYRQLQSSSNVYANKIADLEKSLKNNTASPGTEQALEQYKAGKQTIDTILQRAEKEDEMFKSQSSTATFQNPYGDIKTLRWKVDKGVASNLMKKDLDEAANVFAYQDMDIDVKANPYGVIQAREAASMRVASYKNKLEKIKSGEDDRVNKGLGYRDEQGNYHDYEHLNVVTTEDVKNSSASVTDSYNARELSKKHSKLKTETLLDPYMQQTLSILDRAVNDGKISKDQLNELFTYKDGHKVTYEQFKEAYLKNPDWYIRNKVGVKGLKTIQSNVNNWIKNNRTLSLFENGQSQDYLAYKQFNQQLSDYYLFAKADVLTRQKQAKAVIAELQGQGMVGAKYLFDENGNRRTQSEYYKALPDKLKNKYSRSVSSKYVNNNYKDEFGVSDIELGVPNQVIKGVIYDSEVNYENLSKMSNKAFMDNKLMKDIIVPGYQPSPTGSGTGLFANKVSNVTINPFSDASKIIAGNIFADLNNLRLGDNAKATFSGLTKTTYDTKTNDKRDDIAKMILQDLQQEMRNNKTKLKEFNIQYSPLAAGNANKAAIVLKLPKSYLEKFKDQFVTVDKENNKSYAMYDAALANGISFISDDSNFNNYIKKNALGSPLQNYVDVMSMQDDQKNKGYTTTYDNDPNKVLNITKDKLTGGYSIQYKYPVWNPKENKFEEESQTLPTVPNLTTPMDYLRMFDQIDLVNTSNYQNSRR